MNSTSYDAEEGRCLVSDSSEHEQEGQHCDEEYGVEQPTTSGGNHRGLIAGMVLAVLAMGYFCLSGGEKTAVSGGPSSTTADGKMTPRPPVWGFEAGTTLFSGYAAEAKPGNL